MGDMIHIALHTDRIVVSSTLLLFDTKSFERVSGRVRACCDAAAAGLSRAARCFLVLLTASDEALGRWRWLGTGL